MGDFRIFLARHLVGGFSDQSPRISGPFELGQGWLKSSTWLKVVVLARVCRALGEQNFCGHLSLILSPHTHKVCAFVNQGM